MKRIILLLICALALPNVSAQTAKGNTRQGRFRGECQEGRNGRFRDERQIW